jgi:hypothetical protein
MFVSRDWFGRSRLTGLAGPDARRFETEGFAAGGAQRDQQSERQNLPCRRITYLQDGE